MDSFLPEFPGFDHPVSPCHSSCSFSRPPLLGGLSPGGAHPAGSAWHQQGAVSGRVGDGILGSLGKTHPGSMCCLVLVPELPRIPSFFPIPVLSAACLDLILSYLLQISAECLSVTSPTQLHIQGDFQMRAGYQPGKHGTSLLSKSIFGINQILLSPSMLLCEYQQASSKMSFKKHFPDERQSLCS